MSAARPGSVMVTAATTPLGAGLVQSLLDDGAAVLAVAIEPPPTLPSHEHLHYRQVDLTRTRDLHDLLYRDARALGVEAVVHTALHRSARHGGRHIHRLNVDVTRQLLQELERHPTIRRFVYRSYAEIYRVDHYLPGLIDELHPLDVSPAAPQRVLDHIEADLTACAAMGMAPFSVAVLRCAEVVAPHSGSQLWDYLAGPACLRPLGFDPMLNLLSIPDAVRALRCALASTATGVFNIPGADTLPLSLAIQLAGRRDVPVPGPLLAPLYALRSPAVLADFRYDLNDRRFHFNGVVDGRRARDVLGYEPRERIDTFPRPTGDRHGSIRRRDHQPRAPRLSS